MSEPVFVPGRELSASFYVDVVEPLVRGWPHAAGLFGEGSDVLGYDDETSTDHDWGPRLQLFVAPADIEPVRHAVTAGLPDTYAGWPVVFGSSKNKPQHRVEVWALRDWLVRQVSIDPREGMTTVDWLAILQQQVLGIVRGVVHADPNGELARLRTQLAWYPDDVWRWLLASQWTKIGQEQAFAGRAAETGDELGSRIIAVRLVRELMRLAFLLERTYWPYTKWFGTAFAELPIAATLTPPLTAASTAATHAGREEGLAAAYELLASRHNNLGLHAPCKAKIAPYASARPHLVIHCGPLVETCVAAITDPWLRELPRLVGSVDQFTDSTDVLVNPRRLAAAYQDR
jgi:hypothetical protein